MAYSKKIILLLSIFFICCLSFLAYTQQKQQDYNYGKSWWTLYFANPKSENLSFVIENHSSQNNFHWEILTEKVQLSQGDVNVELGEEKTINIQSPQSVIGKKIIVKISTPKGSKEIYKNF